MRAVEQPQLVNDLIFAKKLLPQVIDHGGSFMFWQTPNSDEKMLLICHTPTVVQDEISLENSKPGFVFAPFSVDENKFFFHADLLFRFNGNALIEGSDLQHTTYSNTKIDSTNAQDEKPISFHTAKKKLSHKNDYTSLVRTAIQHIAEGSLEKIVLSKYEDVALPENFDLLKIFHQVCDKHPHAFVSLVSSPETGTWLGASPELLVSVDAHQKFRTVALAGTQPRLSVVDLKSVAWTQKEIEEQALVSRYIINCFKKLRVREYEEHGPQTVVAGSLLHLQTNYSVDMNEINFPEFGSVMLKLLHPTSAVCGMPLKAALRFLKTHEGYNRDFYSGYLGPINFDGEHNLFANLRCMQLFETSARIYAGAGITRYSDPEKETAEVNMKIKTLSQFIHSS